MAGHDYRLCIAHDYAQGPINDEQKRVLDVFVDLHSALTTGNEAKSRVTLHFSSDSALEKEALVA